jgi:hypothetical protein
MVLRGRSSRRARALSLRRSVSLRDPAAAPVAQRTSAEVRAARPRTLSPARVCGVGWVVRKGTVVAFAATAFSVNERASAPGRTWLGYFGLFRLFGLVIFVRVDSVSGFGARAPSSRAAWRAAASASVRRVTHDVLFSFTGIQKNIRSLRFVEWLLKSHTPRINAKKVFSILFYSVYVYNVRMHEPIGDHVSFIR